MIIIQKDGADRSILVFIFPSQCTSYQHRPNPEPGAWSDGGTSDTPRGSLLPQSQHKSVSLHIRGAGAPSPCTRATEARREAMRNPKGWEPQPACPRGAPGSAAPDKDPSLKPSDRAPVSGPSPPGSTRHGSCLHLLPRQPGRPGLGLL